MSLLKLHRFGPRFWSSASVLKIKLNTFLDSLILTFYFVIVKINILLGALTDVSVRTEAMLSISPDVYCWAMQAQDSVQRYSRATWVRYLRFISTRFASIALHGVVNFTSSVLAFVSIVLDLPLRWSKNVCVSVILAESRYSQTVQPWLNWNGQLLQWPANRFEQKKSLLITIDCEIACAYLHGVEEHGSRTNLLLLWSIFVLHTLLFSLKVGQL